MKHLVKALLVTLAAPLLGRLLRRSQEPEPGLVVLPRPIRFLAVVCFVFFLFCTVFSALSDAAIAIPIFFALFSCGGIALILASVNYRIIYDSIGFTVRSWIGRETIFRYDQITQFKKTPNNNILFVGKRKVGIEPMAVGGKEFMTFVRERYRYLHGGQDLPPVPKSKHDIFKGNVEHTGTIMAGYISIAVLLFGLLLFSLWFTFFSQSNETNTLRHELCFSSCELSDGRLYLELPGQPLYRISSIDETVDVAAIAAVCDGQTTLTVYSKEFTPSNQEPWYDVRALFCDETPLFSFEESSRLQRQERWILVPFTGLLTLLWGLFVTFSIVVGRNPQKFSQKTWSFFFDNKYLTPTYVRHRRKEPKQ